MVRSAPERSTCWSRFPSAARSPRRAARWACPTGGGRGVGGGGEGDAAAPRGRARRGGRAGGKAGGGADLTPLGHFVVGRYRALQEAVAQASRGHLSALQAEIRAKRG